MPPINVTVDWPDGDTQATVSQNPIEVGAANGATVITWRKGINVQSFAITGLDSTVFNPSDSGGQGPSFTTNDANRNTTPTPYTYTVTAVHTSGRTNSHDPEIENGS